MATESQALWPPLPLEAWRETCDTLHMYTQIIGKIRLALEPMMNEWWQVPLYLTTRGLTTSPMAHGDRFLQCDFDFHDHVVVLATADGTTRRIPLGASVRAFYREVFSTLRAMDLDVRIWPVPVEIVDPIPFEEDTKHATYDPSYARRWWQIMLRVQSAFEKFRARFIGKCSPIMFFWGTFDLTVSRYSGRPMTPPSMDRITRWAYDQEVSSIGFWPGGPTSFGQVIDGAAFFSYFAPRPPALERASIQPTAAFFHEGLGEHLLMYDDVRRAPDPPSDILAFAQSVYDAGAQLAKWPDFTPTWTEKDVAPRIGHVAESSGTEAPSR